MSSQALAFAVHIISLGLTICAIAVADHTGLDWVRGKRATVQAHKLTQLHWAVGIGLGLMIGSGFALFWPMREYLLASPAFYVKMAFVLALVINSLVIERLMHVATTSPFKQLHDATKKKLLLSGTVSAVSWIGAAVTAFFLF